jgi:hypothetical protein
VTPKPPGRITSVPTSYAERLTVPWWSWPAGLVGGAVVAIELSLGMPVLPLIVAALLWLGRLRIAVTGADLRVDDARLPVAVIADVVALDAAGKREALGVGAHPLAFVVQRPWIGGAVQVLLDDPADPTPFWVVSTRRPVELAETLLAAARKA